jgi:hypothetical protein
VTYAQLKKRYLDKHGALVQPAQGWGSLDPTLWLAYSMGRKRGFTDLGTYANKPGDHGYYPAHAFDLGRRDRFRFLGWNYLIARKFAQLLVKNYRELNINYVILGNRIWSREYPYWHSFKNYPKDKSHDFHIHVSGVHSHGPRR